MSNQVNSLQKGHTQSKNQMQLDELMGREVGHQKAGSTTDQVSSKKNKVQVCVHANALGKMIKPGKGHFDPASMHGQMNTYAGYQRESHASVQGWDWMVFHRHEGQNEGELTNHYKTEREKEIFFFIPLLQFDSNRLGYSAYHGLE